MKTQDQLASEIGPTELQALTDIVFDTFDNPDTWAQPEEIYEAEPFAWLFECGLIDIEDYKNGFRAVPTDLGWRIFFDIAQQCMAKAGRIEDGE